MPSEREAADVFDRYSVEHAVRLEPSRTAVLVVDMLNDFIHPDGAMWLPGSDEIVPAIAALLDDARRAGARVVHVQEGHWPDDGHFRNRVPACLFGTWGREIIGTLAPNDGDHVSPKRRYSAFFGTDLDLRLREWDVRTVVVTGVTTNICVRSTVQDAYFLGYDVVVPEDCVHASSHREQESSLHDVRTHFGIVVTSHEIAEGLKTSTELVPRVAPT